MKFRKQIVSPKLFDLKIFRNNRLNTNFQHLSPGFKAVICNTIFQLSEANLLLPIAVSIFYSVKHLTFVSANVCVYAATLQLWKKTQHPFGTIVFIWLSFSTRANQQFNRHKCESKLFPFEHRGVPFVVVAMNGNKNWWKLWKVR